MTGPLAVTSANRSGELEAMSSDDARAMFGEAVAVYLPGVSPGGQASTVVDVTGASPVVLRQGPVAV
jgi:tRNA A37 threonylcarbamoyladenosine synthetase subunit TsaC/SUA5/YrdC